MLRRDLLMVCANPDLIVERGHMIVPCAGAIGLAVRGNGRRGDSTPASRTGRSTSEALALAAGLSGRADAQDRGCSRVGDAIRTDIAGAVAFGINSLLIARGIHAEELGLHHGELVSDHVQDWVATASRSRRTAIIGRTIHGEA